MSEYFLGEIRVFPWAWPPRGWALCNGAVLPITQNQALFALLGTTYGGDGRVTFALPNFNGRVPVGQGLSPVSGETYVWGATGGAETVSVAVSQMSMHQHPVVAANEYATIPAPGTNYLAQTMTSKTDKTPINLYAAASGLIPLDPGSVSMTGGDQPHANMQPYLAMNFCISMSGIFPSRN